MAAPQHESARHDLEKKRVDRPRRHQRERHAARRRRNLNLVVDSAFGPALREHDSAQAAAEAELRRIDVAPRPVDAARMRQRLDLGARRLEALGGHDEIRLHQGPRELGVRSVVAYLYLDRGGRRVGGRNALGLHRKFKLALRKRDAAAADEILDPHQNAVRNDALRRLGHNLDRERNRQQNETAQIGIGIRKLAYAVREIGDERGVGNPEELRELVRHARYRLRRRRVGNERIARSGGELETGTFAGRLYRGALGGAGTARLGLARVRQSRRDRLAEQSHLRERSRKFTLDDRPELHRERRVEIELSGAAADEESRYVETGAERGQLRERVLHLKERTAVNRIERDRGELAPGKSLLDGARHDSARADLDEHPVAVLVHLADRLGEQHGLRPALRRIPARGARTLGESIRDGARINLAYAFMLHVVGRELLDRGDYRRTVRRIERLVELEPQDPYSRVRERLHRRFLEIGLDREGFHLRRKIADKIDLLFWEGSEDRADVFLVADHRRNHDDLRQALVVDGLADDSVNIAQSLHALGARRACRGGSGLHDGREISAAATDHAVRLKPCRVQKTRHRLASGISRDESLGIRARAENVGVVPVIRRRRENEIRRRETRLADKSLFELVERRTAFGMQHREIAHHVGIKRNRARKHKSEFTLALAQKMIAEIIRSALVLKARHRPGFETVLRRRKSLAQILNRRRDKSENAFAAHKTARIGDIDERTVGNSVDERYEARNLFDKLRVVLG